MCFSKEEIWRWWGIPKENKGQRRNSSGPGRGQEEVSLEESLINFSRCMGLPIEGFEEEIVDLMNRVSGRRYTDKGKGVQSSTKFDRELKRLKWTVKEEGSKAGDRARASITGFL